MATATETGLEQGLENGAARLGDGRLGGPRSGDRPPRPRRCPQGQGECDVVARRTAVLGGALLVLLTAALTAALTLRLAPRVRGGAPTGAEATALRLLTPTPGLRNLLRGLVLIQSRYLTAPDMSQVTAAALRGAVASLHDPYSTYLTPRGFQVLRSTSRGRYSGIGVSVRVEPGLGPVVTGLFPGSPAATAPFLGAPPGAQPGLRVGDRLLAADGVPLGGLAAAAVRSRLSGPAGSRVLLEVERAGSGGAPMRLSFALTRHTLVVPTVQWRMLPGHVGYLAIQMFNDRTPGEVGQGLKALAAEGMRGLVLDLRNNPGGVLQAAVQVSRYFLPAGVVARLHMRHGAPQVFTVPAPRPVGVPCTVLVNGHTASAAELLAGAIQDDHRGLLVGERTFGKGVVQRVFPLGGGAALKLTVGRYSTPRGREIGGRGLAPDVRVAFPGETQAALGNPAEDPQLAAALGVLRRPAA